MTLMKKVIQHPTVRKHIGQGTLFVVSGTTGAAIEFVTLWLLVNPIGVPEQYALFFSCLGSITFVYFFNKYRTFKEESKLHVSQTIRFISVYIPAIGMNYAISLTLFHYGVHYLLAKAISIGIVAIFNYILSSSFIFKKQTVLAS